MENSNSLENFKSQITHENKTTYGAVVIIIGFIIWGITHEYAGLFLILLVTIPSILLIIPNESIRNNKVLGLLLALIVLFMILVCIISISADYSYDLYDYHFYDFLLLFYCILNLVSCYMLTVQTKKVETGNANNTSKISAHSKNNFCRHCGTKLDEDSQFCPSCGKKI